jgi:hypothetical protein
VAPGVVRAAAVLVAAALPALVACGPKATNDSPLPTGGVASVPAGAGPSSRPPAGPELAFPADVHLSFDYADTGDQGKDAVMHDWEAGQRVFAYAQTVPDPRFPTLGRYYAANALADAVATLSKKVKAKQTVIGTRRYYQVSVIELSGSYSRLKWCVDDSRFFARNAVTKKAIVHHGPGDYYRITGILQRDPKLDTWVLIRATSEVGVQC